MKPIQLHCLNSEPVRRLARMEPGKSRWGDAIWTFIIGAMVAYLFAWGAGIIQ